MRKYLRTGVKLAADTRAAWDFAGFERVPFFAGPFGNPLAPDSLLINYGCSKPLYDYHGVLLNHPSRIERTRVEELPKYIGEYMPIVQLDQNVIVKTNGSKGRGKLVVADGTPVVVQRLLWPAREFRVVTWDVPGHMDPEVLAWSEKYCEDPLDPACWKDFDYRPTYELPHALRVLVLAAHEKLGLNFVGWDVLLPEDRSGYWIIEANSAPGIGDQTSRRLRKRLRRVLPELAVAA